MRTIGQSVVLAVAAGLVAGLAASGQTLEKRALSLDDARRVVAAARQEAAARNAPGSAIAVVDEGGHLVVLERLDGTFAAGAAISIGKARTAALFRRRTGAFEEIINKGRTAMTALDDFTPLQGGVPIVVNGAIIGAVGVSGAASAQQDEEIAVAAAAALMTPPVVGTAGVDLAVFHEPGERVRAAFAAGKPIVETATYKVHASRRDRDGQAEIHLRDTDIVHVLEGTATLVTGGTVTSPMTTAPDEIRGTAIDGGESRKVGPGDVVVLPHGVPHLFKDVHGPFLYYVVKVTAPRRAS